MSMIFKNYFVPVCFKLNFIILNICEFHISKMVEMVMIQNSVQSSQTTRDTSATNEISSKTILPSR